MQSVLRCEDVKSELLHCKKIAYKLDGHKNITQIGVGHSLHQSNVSHKYKKFPQILINIIMDDCGNCSVSIKKVHSD